MEAIFADRLPEDLTQDSLREICEYYAAKDGSDKDEAGVPASSADAEADGGGEACGARRGANEPPRVRASQAIHVTLHVFRSAFIGSVAFARRMLAQLPAGFPAPGTRSARMCSAFIWDAPPTRAA